jgi:hypothetical protein
MRGARARTLQAPGEPSLPSYADDPEIMVWIDLLLLGKPDEQARARTEIGLIFEDRGDLAAAEDVYWANVQARATDRRSYHRLIVLYQKRGDRLSETLVQRQMETVFDGENGDSAPPPSVHASLPFLGTSDSHSSPLPPAPSTASRERGSHRHAEGPSTDIQHPDARPKRRLRRRHDAPTNAPAADEGKALLKAVPVVSAGDASGKQRRRAGFSPSPSPFARSGSLIVLQPSMLGVLLLASIGTAALIAVVLIATGWRGFGFGASSQVPARCVDASIRFPGAHDPRAAVVAAYRQNGVDVEATRPGGARLTFDAATQVIGGWIGASLLLEHAGQPTPSLATWLSTEPDRPTLANAMLSGRALDGLLTADEWAEIRDWPASSCEGAFVHDPRNAAPVQLIERVVAR